MKWFRRKSTYSGDGPFGFGWDGEWFTVKQSKDHGLFIVTDGDGMEIAAGWTAVEAAEQAGYELAWMKQKIEDDLEEMYS